MKYNRLSNLSLFAGNMSQKMVRYKVRLFERRFVRKVGGFSLDNKRQEIIRRYFKAWIDVDMEIVKQTFTDNVVYTECYGPEYHGLSQIENWFVDWHKKGQVLEWTIKRIIEQNCTLVVEWYFKCNYDGNVNGFDGVTIADFDDMRIFRLREFQSKSEHFYPYKEEYIYE